MANLQDHMMEQIEKLKDAEGEAEIRLEINKTRAMAEIATVLVESAKAEVSFFKATGEDHSKSFFCQTQPPALPPPPPKQLHQPETQKVESVVSTVENAVVCLPTNENNMTCEDTSKSREEKVVEKVVEKTATANASGYVPSLSAQTNSKNDLINHRKFVENWE